jgi:hypothetical protein
MKKAKPAAEAKPKAEPDKGKGAAKKPGKAKGGY